MRYAMLICIDETEVVSHEEAVRRSDAFDAFAARAGARGMLLGGERLRPTATATSVRVSNGDVVIADGPFAETKEQMGGFFLVECKDLDEAIALAAELPAAEYGTIEVRPVWER